LLQLNKTNRRAWQLLSQSVLQKNQRRRRWQQSCRCFLLLLATTKQNKKKGMAVRVPFCFPKKIRKESVVAFCDAKKKKRRRRRRQRHLLLLLPVTKQRKEGDSSCLPKKT
jgi:hypothetical protein